MTAHFYWIIKSMEPGDDERPLPLRKPELFLTREAARAAQKQYTLPKEQRIDCVVTRVLIREE